MSTERIEFDGKAAIGAAVERLEGELVKRGVPVAAREVIKQRARHSFLRVGEEVEGVEALVNGEWKSGAIEELAAELASHVPPSMILPGSDVERERQEAERETVQRIVADKRRSGAYDL
jgi:hypothetical protein